MRKTKLQKLEQELKILTDKCIKKQQEIDSHKRKYVYITCNGVFRRCGKKFRVGILPYIQEEWYVEPWGCNDGDYWKDGSVVTICPNCGVRIKIKDENLKYRPDLFKEKLYERKGKLYEKSVYDR